MNVTASETITGLPNNIGGIPQAVQNAVTYAKGIAASQCDTVGIWSGTIAGSGTKNVFLSTGTPNLTDFVGQAAIIFARVKFVYLLLSTATPASSISFFGGTHAFRGPLPGTTDVPSLNNGAAFLWFDITATGVAVTVSSNDQINLVNNDGTNAATVTLVVGGGAT